MIEEILRISWLFADIFTLYVALPALVSLERCGGLEMPNCKTPSSQKGLGPEEKEEL